MKKIIALGALSLSLLALTAPAHADNDSTFDGVVNAADNWNFSATVVCLTEVAVAPVLGSWAGHDDNNCTNGNVIDHPTH
ncbi:hypothetical protein [Kitasatospora purpeofusca]|uniref:hypothetical protein n=1 Tax=Kitasatospora purpeofusca TaxID=67352 RepID=UPI00369D6A97